jgi:DNA invertase Pin-like site-specific DNA recombinase
MGKADASSCRCAVYTRKSSEEGLEQAFNSLHAQREACEAFIRSQRGEGWRVIDAAYDDGGLSGGTLERPALQRLFQDISQGRVDIVVVYKVDRLTRSLMDFAKIVEQFDRHSVSFIAVTQQFNTTTSMGRLTLNILLSFAQFEREVTGERIRDKIAASKRKGMWMGGVPPLGYEVRNRKLIIDPVEATIVRLIYQRYQALGSVRDLKTSLDRDGVHSKVRTYGDGRRSGGRTFSRGALYALLSNPLYIGEVSHKGIRYPGQHAPILDRLEWESVQRLLRDRGSARRGTTGKVMPSPLAGKLFDDGGLRLTPTHATKAGRRYRYYVSRELVTGAAAETQRGWRLPAAQIEKLVAAEAATMLADRGSIAAALEKADLPMSTLPHAFAAADSLRQKLLSDTDRGEVLAVLIDRIEVREDSIRLALNLGALLPETEANTSELILVREVPQQVRRRGVEMRLVLASGTAPVSPPDPVLLKVVARAYRCFDALVTGRALSIAEVAQREAVDERYISNILPLAFLAPEIVEAIVRGTQPPDLTAKKLVRRTDLPLDWQAQRGALGFQYRKTI